MTVNRRPAGIGYLQGQCNEYANDIEKLNLIIIAKEG